MTQFTDWLAEEDRQRRMASLHRDLHHRSPASDTLDLASNDYLGLSRDVRVIAGARSAADTWGAGSTGSRLVTGSTELLRDLESDLASFMGYESALVFSSGYLANLGAVTALAGPDCLIISDQWNHASLIDACRLSRSEVLVAPHVDPETVANLLANRRQPRALIVTDAVFSVDGDLAPLIDLHHVARASGAALLVDEAHSLGVVGPGGKGATTAAGLSGEPDVIATATLSKSLASQGGAVLATSEVRSHIINRARSFIFDTALVPAAAGAARVALQVLRQEPQLSDRANVVAAQLRGILHEIGWSSPPPAAAVVSAPIADSALAVLAADTCRESGVLVGCFRPPSVPDGIPRLRLTARANLTEAQLLTTSRALQLARQAVIAAEHAAAHATNTAQSTAESAEGRTT